MSKKWRGDTTKQQIQRACESRPAAELLSFLTSVYHLKKAANPKEPPGSPDLWVEGSTRYLAEKLGYCTRTIKRAVKTLTSRQFVTTHTLRSFDRSFKYEVHIEAVERWLQRMPLFEEESPWGQDVTVHGDKESPSMVTGCHRARGHGVTVYIASSLSSESIINNADDAALDDEKEKIVSDYRVIGVAKEKTEYLLTIHTRQKMKAGLVYVRMRCDREKINNPPGLLMMFLQNPADHGYELNKQGCWVSARAIAAVPKPVKPEPTPTPPESQTWWEKSTPEQRRRALDKMSTSWLATRVVKWRNEDPELKKVPLAIAAELQKSLLTM